MSDGFKRVWETYFNEHPTCSRLAKDGGIIVIGLPHPCGCKYCRGVITSEVSQALTQQVKDAGKRIDMQPTCATKKCQ